MKILVTIGIALLLFGLAALALSVKVIFGKKTPLKEHACDVMCRHGHNHPCTCSGEGECADSPPPE